MYRNVERVEFFAYIGKSGYEEHLMVESTITVIRSPKCDNFGCSSNVLNDSSRCGISECFEETEEHRNKNLFMVWDEFRVTFHQALFGLSFQMFPEPIQTRNIPAVCFLLCC